MVFSSTEGRSREQFHGWWGETLVEPTLPLEAVRTERASRRPLFRRMLTAFASLRSKLGSTESCPTSSGSRSPERVQAGQRRHARRSAGPTRDERRPGVQRQRQNHPDGCARGSGGGRPLSHLGKEPGPMEPDRNPELIVYTARRLAQIYQRSLE